MLRSLDAMQAIIVLYMKIRPTIFHGVHLNAVGKLKHKSSTFNQVNMRPMAAGEYLNF